MEWRRGLRSTLSRKPRLGLQSAERMESAGLRRRGLEDTELMHTDLRSIAVGRPERGARGAAFASFFSGSSSYRCVLIVVILRVW